MIFLVYIIVLILLFSICLLCLFCEKCFSRIPVWVVFVLSTQIPEKFDDYLTPRQGLVVVLGMLSSN